MDLRVFLLFVLQLCGFSFAFFIHHKDTCKPSLVCKICAVYCYPKKEEKKEEPKKEDDHHHHHGHLDFHGHVYFWHPDDGELHHDDESIPILYEDHPGTKPEIIFEKPWEKPSTWEKPKPWDKPETWEKPKPWEKPEPWEKTKPWETPEIIWESPTKETKKRSKRQAPEDSGICVFCKKKCPHNHHHEVHCHWHHHLFYH